jgi:hypothetical protein
VRRLVSVLVLAQVREQLQGDTGEREKRSKNSEVGPGA